MLQLESIQQESNCFVKVLHAFLFKNVNINFILYLFCTGPYYIIWLHFTLATIHAYIFYSNITFKYLYVYLFFFKNFNINVMLYLIYTGPYYTICLHFTLTMIRGYAFYFNMCLYLHLFLWLQKILKIMAV